MSLQLDMSEMPAGVLDEFIKGRHAREVMTLQRAPRLQDLEARALPLEQRALDGMGGCHMVVATDAFHYWGRRLGYACWSDKAFREEFKRDNPAARVRSTGTRIQVGYRSYVPSDALKTKFPAKILV